MMTQISDVPAFLPCAFSNFNAALKQLWRRGDVLARPAGKRSAASMAQDDHPEYRLRGDLSTPELRETLTPVCPTTGA